MESIRKKGRSVSEKRLKYVPEINLYKKWRKSLRRRKNINTTGRTCISDTGFVLNSKLKNVHKVNRLQFLISHLRLNKPDIPVQEMINGRKGFNDNKKWALPLTKRSECYLCGGKATLRHHVIPLSKGGKNKVNNITPLCIHVTAKYIHICRKDINTKINQYIILLYVNLSN